jgi:hypothetical protein
MTDSAARALAALALLTLCAAPARAQVTPRPAGPEIPRLPPSFPLLCRGTPGLNVSVASGRTGLLLFRRSAGPASAGLAPGECAWRDRAVRAAEPAVVAHVVPEGADGDPPYQWPVVLQDSARYWLFHVYNDGRRLVATRSREERP